MAESVLLPIQEAKAWSTTIPSRARTNRTPPQARTRSVQRYAERHHHEDVGANPTGNRGLQCLLSAGRHVRWKTANKGWLAYSQTRHGRVYLRKRTVRVWRSINVRAPGKGERTHRMVAMAAKRMVNYTVSEWNATPTNASRWGIE